MPLNNPPPVAPVLTQKEQDDIKWKAPPIVKKAVHEHLKDVDYDYLNNGSYQPSEFALEFVSIMKLINGAEQEEEKTPAVHLAMLDNIAGRRIRTVNLCHRGMGKTTIMFEYLMLYLALKNNIPGFGSVTGVIFIGNSIEKGVRDALKNIENRYEKSAFMKKHMKSATFTAENIEFINKDGGNLGIRMYGGKTPPRGVRMFGLRPQLAILDDLIGDGDAPSKKIMDMLKETVFAGVTPAMYPKRHKIILSGTPFNSSDIMSHAVNSGSWHTNVYPLCDKFPCTKEEYKPAWGERFPYEVALRLYEDAVLDGMLSTFYKEYMLQITSDEERLVQDHEIQKYDRDLLLRNRSNYNFYITTDFAVTDGEKSDNSVISVWALNNNGDWYWVDGLCGRYKIDYVLDNLIKLCQAYNPRSVGVETSGQQAGFIPWIIEKQNQTNVFFNFAKQNKKMGIKPVTDKLARFQMIVPKFADGKMWFPEQLWETPIMKQFRMEMELATMSGLKGSDDCLDTISMLTLMQGQPPSNKATPVVRNKYFAIDEEPIDQGPLSELIV